jgi:hypothetical protein
MCKPAKRKRSAALSDFLWGLLSGGIVIAVSWFSHTFGQKKAYDKVARRVALKIEREIEEIEAEVQGDTPEQDLADRLNSL